MYFSGVSRNPIPEKSQAFMISKTANARCLCSLSGCREQNGSCKRGSFSRTLFVAIRVALLQACECVCVHCLDLNIDTTEFPLHGMGYVQASIKCFECFAHFFLFSLSQRNRCFHSFTVRFVAQHIISVVRYVGKNRKSIVFQYSSFVCPRFFALVLVYEKSIFAKVNHTISSPKRQC